MLSTVEGVGHTGGLEGRAHPGEDRCLTVVEDPLRDADAIPPQQLTAHAPEGHEADTAPFLFAFHGARRAYGPDLHVADEAASETACTLTATWQLACLPNTAVLVGDADRHPAVLGERHVIDRPGVRADPRHHPLGDPPAHLHRIPGGLVYELLQVLLVAVSHTESIEPSPTYRFHSWSLTDYAQGWGCRKKTPCVWTARGIRGMSTAGSSPGYRHWWSVGIRGLQYLRGGRALPHPVAVTRRTALTAVDTVCAKTPDQEEETDLLR